MPESSTSVRFTSQTAFPSVPLFDDMGKITRNSRFLAVAGVGLFGDGYLNISVG